MNSFARPLVPLLLLGLILQTQVFAQFAIHNAKIEYIIDGDTFITTINNKTEKVRMKCIDAPELKQTFIGFDGIKKEIGIEARKYLIKLLQDNNNIIFFKCSDNKSQFSNLVPYNSDNFNIGNNNDQIKENNKKKQWDWYLINPLQSTKKCGIIYY